MSELAQISAAKTWRKRIVIFVSVVVVLDFLSRLVFIGDDATNNNNLNADGAAAQVVGSNLLDKEQVEQLFAWSDIKPKEPEKPKVVAATVAPVQPAAPPPKPKVDVHKQVAERIRGDKSKFLIKDDLLTLKGLFYDGQEFAVVEVENIVTKQKQYFRSSVNKALGSHKLEQIGKNFVVVSSGNQKVTLYMFGAGRS